jgi:hypothetical protein
MRERRQVTLIIKLLLVLFFVLLLENVKLLLVWTQAGFVAAFMNTVYE